MYNLLQVCTGRARAELTIVNFAQILVLAFVRVRVTFFYQFTYFWHIFNQVVIAFVMVGKEANRHHFGFQKLVGAIIWYCML